MATATIADLTENATPLGSSYVAVDEAGSSYKTQIDDLVAAAALAATINFHKGTHASLAALITAHPSPPTGSFAVVTQGDGTDASLAVWDSDESTPAWKIASVAAIAHAASHQSGGADEILLDDLGTPTTGGTDLDATGTTHGLLPHADKAKLDMLTVGAASTVISDAERTSFTNATFAVTQAARAWTFSTSTGTPPASGGVRLNNATPASVTAMYISDTDTLGLNVETIVADWDEDTHIVIGQLDDVALRMLFRVNGTVTDNTTYYTVPITLVGTPSALFGNTKTVYVLDYPVHLTSAEKTLITTNQTNIAAVGPTSGTLTDADPIVYAPTSKIDTRTCLLTAGVGATRAMGVPSGANVVFGAKFEIKFKQSSGGGNAVTWGSEFKFPNGVDAVLSTGANEEDVISMSCYGTSEFVCAKVPNVS